MPRIKKKKKRLLDLISMFSKVLKYKWTSLVGGSDGKESACSAGDPGSVAGLGRSPGEENDNAFQYSFLEIP